MAQIKEQYNLFNVNSTNLLFIHIPKTGGTSILHKIHYYLKIGDLKVRHCLASEYYNEIWESSFSFAVIRNPFDRLVSHWKYHVTANDSNLLNRLGVENHKNLSFSDYVNLIQALNDKVTNWRPMTEYITHPSGKKISAIFRFENLKSDWENSSISKQIGTTLPYLKKSEHTHYSHYYTNELIDKVSSFYKTDLLEFGYSFEKKQK